jgi:hypothetical protein
MMYSIAAFVDEIIMSEEVVKRYDEESENEDPAYLGQQQENPVPPPEPIYDNTIDNNSDKMMMTPDDSDAVKATKDTATATKQSEPLLPTVQNEKMVYINDRAFPIAEDKLTAREILERTGFAPNEYTLYVIATENAKAKPLKEGERLQIKNEMKLNAILNTRSEQKAR